MGSVAVLNIEGTHVGESELCDDIFFTTVHEEAIHQTLRGQLAAKRRGTASTRTRNEVSGGGRKPWRQKGTGRARHGSIRSPLWVGGGITFGPKPRKYSQRTPKKVKSLALRSALSQLRSEENLILLESLELEEPKTKKMVSILEGLGLSDKKVLILTASKDENVYKSARNLPMVKVMPAAGLNLYDLLNCEKLVLTEEARLLIEEALSR